jgi:hypothetical protein
MVNGVAKDALNGTGTGILGSIIKNVSGKYNIPYY